MSDSSSSSEDDISYPMTPEDWATLQQQRAECDQLRNACQANLESLQEQFAVIQDQIHKERLKMTINYNISDIHGGKSQAYLGLLQRLQKAIKEKKVEIYTMEAILDCQPRLEKLLPVMLVADSNLEMADLRKYILEDTSRFRNAIPHTTRYQQDFEEEGRDYYFITKQRFCTYKNERLFLEFGEYHNDEFGTSLNAIKNVVNCGHICILKVRHLTLKTFRLTDLHPLKVYVAFIEREEFEKEE